MTDKADVVNPFPLEAVATWGESLRTCENLGYMQSSLEELSDYMLSYPVKARRKGGAIGIRGGHGSGKTHLVMWLGEKARAIRTLEAEVLYSKCDSASLFSAYRQLIEDLSHRELKKAIHLALERVALQQAARAEATSELKRRLEDGEVLETLFRERLLDPEKLHNELLDRLRSTHTPEIIARTLLDSDDAARGSIAYRWLLGEPINPTEDSQLSLGLRSVGEGDSDHEKADVAAAHALEVLARLYSVAERPLIIIIDQLEVLFRTGDARLETLFSVLKKWVEQIGSRAAFVIVAGSEEAWAKLPRDVTPRLRTRVPLQAGCLSREEAQALLDAHRDEADAFSDSAVDTIHRLSGGNPREILRIAHAAFDRVEGALSTVGETEILECARETGSIEDRYELALSIADPVLHQYGDVSSGVAVAPGVTLDRLVRVEGVPRIALQVVRATDTLAEIDSARRVHTLRAALSASWPSAQLINVSVGYSSGQIEQLLGTTSNVILFEETNFASLLQAGVLKILAEQPAKEAAQRGNEEIQKLLEQMAQQLGSLERERRDVAESTQAKFEQATRELTQPSREAREDKTRWAVLERLDDLEDALRKKEPWREREFVRAILVSNESYLHLNELERLGARYLDLIAKERAEEVAAGSVRRLRMEILRALRRAVRNDALMDRWLNRKARVAWFVAGLAVAAPLVLILPETLYVLDGASSAVFLLSRLGTVAAGGFGVWVATYALGQYVSGRRLRQIEMRATDQATP